MDWLARVENIRQKNSISKGKNIAIADCYIENKQEELIAVSGQRTIAGTVALPVNPIFNCEYPPGHLRPYDAEYKIMEEIAARFSQNKKVKGSISLYTERKPCTSCRYVIDQFQKAFPNIEINIFHDNVA